VKVTFRCRRSSAGVRSLPRFSSTRHSPAEGNRRLAIRNEISRSIDISHLDRSIDKSSASTMTDGSTFQVRNFDPRARIHGRAIYATLSDALLSTPTSSATKHRSIYLVEYRSLLILSHRGIWRHLRHSVDSRGTTSSLVAPAPLHRAAPCTL